MNHKLLPSLGLDLVSLRVFMAASEEKGLARAAAREHIALSAASRRISDFEARAGVVLFERRDRGMVLTPAGERVFVQVTELFEKLDRIALELEGLRMGASGHVRIHAHMSAMSSDLPEQVAHFLAGHPGIDVEVVEQTSPEVVHALHTGLADIGIASGTVEMTGLDTRPWRRDELVVLLQRGHRLSEKGRIKFLDVIDEPFIAMQQSSALLSLFRARARTLGKELRARAHATSFDTVLKMVSLGLGVSILPASPVRAQRSADVWAKPLDEDWATRALVLGVRDSARLTTAAKLMLGHLSTPAPIGS
jgi:DNA-binding transcriptional LysR family regulator